MGLGDDAVWLSEAELSSFSKMFPWSVIPTPLDITIEWRANKDEEEQQSRSQNNKKKFAEKKLEERGAEVTWPPGHIGVKPRSKNIPMRNESKRITKEGESNASSGSLSTSQD